MKNKMIALLTSAVVGVMSFTPVITARAATLWEDICSECGEYSIIATVNARERKTKEEYISCQNGYDNHGDIWSQNWARVSYYCGDCNRHWEEWVPDGAPYWYCPYAPYGE